MRYGEAGDMRTMRRQMCVKITSAHPNLAGARLVWVTCVWMHVRSDTGEWGLTWT